MRLLIEEYIGLIQRNSHVESLLQESFKRELVLGPPSSFS